MPLPSVRTFFIIGSQQPRSIGDDGHVISFQPRGNMARRGRWEKVSIGGVRSGSSPVAGLKKYEDLVADDDYPHRMIVNAIAMIFTIVLIVAGVWITNRLARAEHERMHRPEELTTMTLQRPK